MANMTFRMSLYSRVKKIRFNNANAKFSYLKSDV